MKIRLRNPIYVIQEKSPRLYVIVVSPIFLLLFLTLIPLVVVIDYVRDLRRIFGNLFRDLIGSWFRQWGFAEKYFDDTKQMLRRQWNLGWKSGQNKELKGNGHV